MGVSKLKLNVGDAVVIRGIVLQIKAGVTYQRNSVSAGKGSWAQVELIQRGRKAHIVWIPQTAIWPAGRASEKGSEKP